MKAERIIIAAAIALFTAASAHAQLGFGVGFTNNGLHQKVDAKDDLKENTSLNGVYLLADYTFHIGKHFGIAPGVQYEFLTTSLEEIANKDLRQSEHYINIPVKLSYSFQVVKALRLGCYAAPTFSLGAASKLKYDGAKINLFGKETSIEKDEIKVESGYSRGDFMLGLGLFADILDHLRINFGYDYGLVNRVDTKDASLHRSRVQIGVSCLF